MKKLNHKRTTKPSLFALEVRSFSSIEPIKDLIWDTQGCAIAERLAKDMPKPPYTRLERDVGKDSRLALTVV